MVAAGRRIDYSDTGCEAIEHLLVGCSHSRETWFRILRQVNLEQRSPDAMSPFIVWWMEVRKLVAKARRPGFDTLVVLIAWNLWKERNNSFQV